MNDDRLTPASASGETGALDVARRAFSLLTTGPHPLALDGRGFPGLPARLVPLDEVREALLHRRCSQALRDQVWAHLVTRSRAESGAWTVACVGLALPALTTIAARLSARFAADPADLHSAVLAGFLGGLAEIDLAPHRPGIMNRLRWAAFRAGHTALREALDSPTPASEAPALAACVDGSGSGAAEHPDLVLARAVADGVLTPGDADVIAATRLDRHPLTHVAAELGCSYEALKKHRRRAERRLADHLARQGEHPCAPTSPPGERSPSIPGRGIDSGQKAERVVSQHGAKSGVQG